MAFDALFNKPYTLISEGIKSSGKWSHLVQSSKKTHKFIFHFKDLPMKKIKKILYLMDSPETTK